MLCEMFISSNLRLNIMMRNVNTVLTWLKNIAYIKYYIIFPLAFEEGKLVIYVEVNESNALQVCTTVDKQSY